MGSKAGEAFRRIAQRIRGEEVPLMNLEVSNPIMEKLRKLIGMR